MTPVHFLLNWEEYDTERAKLEKDIKEIFYKDNCHKLNITIDDLLGECDLPSQDAFIVRKKVEEFILATRKEIYKEKKRDQILSTYFFYAFISIFLILLFQYTCIKIRSLNWLSHEDCLCTLVKCMLVIRQELLVTKWSLFMQINSDVIVNSHVCHLCCK